MDRTKEVGKEGICSECQEEKMIIACQGGEVFCKECYNKEPSTNCQKCGKKIDSSKELPLCNECERDYMTE